MKTTHNKSLYIDREAVATLAMARDGILKPVTKLMNKKESQEVNATGTYQGSIFPFSFILSPAGKRNHEVLKSAKSGETLTLICDNKQCGTLIVEEVFKIDKDERIQKIYGTNNPEHPGVKDTYKRLGTFAVSGEYTIEFDAITHNIKKTNKTIANLEAKTISSIILSGKPFHRVHERLIRTALVKCDLLIIFLH